MFIRQRIHSNYCAVYSTAMLLSQLGYAIDRASAIKLFQANRKQWCGATHGEILSVIKKVDQKINAQWHYCNPRTPVGLLRIVRRHWSGKPLLMTAYCFHSAYKIADWHAFLIVDASTTSVAILDPLARAPNPGQTGNVELESQAKCDGRYIVISGAGWELDLSCTVSIMVTK